MRNPVRALTAALLSPLVGTLLLAGDANWSTYLGDTSSSQYSLLDQITPDNVTGLEVAWTWHAGDARGNSTQIQCNPLVIDGVIYATTPSLRLVALDAETGEEKWRFVPHEPTGVNRGVATWSDGGSRRILFGAGKWLQAVDAVTGELIESFGEGGRVDLGADMGRDVTGFAIQANTPGLVHGDLIIMGMRLGEGPAPAAPGPIRAYNVRTGELVWTFHTIPQPGEPGHETWPAEAWRSMGGVNVWTGMSVDEERGLLFAPTGSASFDFWGGDRVGDNLYANCLLALNIETGERVWHYQFVHHDIWDRDLPAPPNLLTVTHDGVEIDAVAQITKSGHVFVFNRETGEPLFPIEEVAVPSSDVAGEVTSPTQPIPTMPAPFARQLFTANEITDRTPEAHRAVLNQFARLRPHTLFAPPSKEGTIVFPGFDGGGEWGGAATDPNGILYVNANEMAWILTLIENGGGTSEGAQVYLQNCAGCHGVDRQGNAAGIPSLVDLDQRLNRDQTMDVVTHGRGMMPPWGFLTERQRQAVVGFLLDQSETGPPRQADPEMGNAPKEEGWQTYVGDQGKVDRPAPAYTHTGYNRFLDPDGYPAVRPPWGTLNAIDLNTGEYLWRVPLGELPELTARGIPPTGTENYGGPIVTAGGLVFIAASKDEHIRAYEAATGRELWRYPLPAGGYATPSTYEVNGRQYVIIACGGGKMGTKSGDAYVAFALPE
ncbi:PQQ-binding-like beta-propeller repeat protein [Synoicihabitans lomoniglobus]|uniref:PQQ-binding-like beta-propeller repeat protein n=1 Tax=Synoicihabitans lomoniglobus TaxID=2909285 RepID=A0AAF0CRB3_9BACT|nr:PQQ-binding-like beta-propeller repeat protein [Opitutaceae bacterium LMO-M01]WED66604.1 PQQ-binding-like beta-propeller repeat protein [Opitutaceae bacterium LMO-M01]